MVVGEISHFLQFSAACWDPMHMGWGWGVLDRSAVGGGGGGGGKEDCFF